ncbi:hypothetical protein [Tautonia plasticadhaerens]|uniref:Uncharacterized protein n=1 Tax=Tautonia plasticadhaerens TaxID=2527974 RepID=A0A518HDY1_9BACT|nr:hypothetical protein [Tautonia plasticadhaerens]QDV39062.1 hypothetical protein ElP_70250 [Tautonia plasticadhaerens]
MRRLNPAVTLTTALLTAAAAASPIVGLAAQVVGPPDAPRRAPEAPEAPEAIASSDPMASARAPRHLLRNGQDYLRYGEYARALALFREAEARIGELAPAEREELLGAIEAARQGLRTPESADPAVANRRPSARSRDGRMPGAIALATPPLPAPGPSGSPDGVMLTGGERPEPPVPVAPEPIAVDDSVLPSSAPSPSPAPPEPIELPPIQAAAAPGPVAPAPASPEPTMPAEPPAPVAGPESSPTPAEPPAAPEPSGPAGTLPPLPGEAPAAGWPSEAVGALPPGRLRSPEAAPAPPDELPALPPSAEELMELGSRVAGPGAESPAPMSAPAPAPSVSPGSAPPRAVVDARGGEGAPAYRDLLSPEQREEVMMMVRRQEEAEQEGLMPAPLDDFGGLGYDQDDLSSSSIQLPRPPSPTEIRPIQSIPVPEDFVPLPPRRFNPSRKYWTAAATCHAPLYFQDPVLERYGQSVEQKLGPVGRFLSYPLDDRTQSRQRNQIAQPFFSAALFAAQIATWPYKAIVDPPGEAEYDLGYYRPGDLVPPDLIYVPVHGIGPPGRGRHY